MGSINIKDEEKKKKLKKKKKEEKTGRETEVKGGDEGRVGR